MPIFYYSTCVHFKNFNYVKIIFQPNQSHLELNSILILMELISAKQNARYCIGVPVYLLTNFNFAK